MKKITLLLLLAISTQLTAQLNEGFDTTELPTGWTVSDGIWVSGATTNGNSSVSPRTGEAMALFKISSYDGVSVLSTPSQDLTSFASPMLTFYYTTVNWGVDIDDLTIYYKDSASGEWTLIQTYTTVATDWTKVEIILPNPSADYYIGFEGSSDWGYGITLDDVSIDEAPSCVTPTGLTATSINSTGAIIDWVSDGTGFMIEIQPGGVAQGTAGGYVIGDVTNYPATTLDLTGINPDTGVGYLASNTEYSMYVVNVCEGGNSEYAGPLTFTTECAAFAAPYSNGFEDLACWTNDNSSAPWQLGDGTNPGFGTPNPGSVTEGVSAVFFNSYSYSTVLGESTLMSPSIDLSALTVPNLTFDFVDSGTDSGGTDVVEVVVDNGTGAVVVSTLEQPQTWTEVTVDLSAYANETINIGFRVTSDYGYSNPHIDNLKVAEAPSCPTPTDLTATGISPTGALINWASDGTGFMIEIQLGGVAQGTPNTGTAEEPSVYVIGDVQPYTSTTLDLTGYLDPTTSYSVYVVNVCEDGNSEYAGPLDFTTTAFPIVPDYTNDFSSFPGDLWSQATGTIADGPSGTSAGWSYDDFLAPTYARINLWNADTIDWLISPEFDLSGQVYYLNLDVSVTAYNGGGEISMGSDDVVSLVMTTDGVTWTILKQWSAADNLGNEFVSMSEIPLVSSIDGRFASNTRFAIHASEGTADDAEDYYFNIDNFSITSSSLGINNSQISQFTYFPNPVNDQLTINAQTSVDDIAVLNMLGQVVSRQSPNSLNCLVDMAALRTGVYFVQVSIGNKTETVRILKQ